jgi:uncharacterized membrane protein
MPHRYASTSQLASEPDRFVVLGFAEEQAAFELRELLCDMEEDGILEIGDAVVATSNAKGKVRLHQSLSLVSIRTAVGCFSGMFIGLLLLNPLVGVMAGAAVGALAGALWGIGIDDALMKKLGKTLTPGSSTLFVMVRKTKPAELIQCLTPFAGRCKILQNTTTADNKTTLRNLLEGELSRADFRFQRS